MKRTKKEVMKKSTLFKRTIPYMKKEKGLLAITILLCLIISLLSAFTPFITKAVLDKYLPNSDYDMVFKALALYGIVMIVLFATKYVFAYVNTLCGMKIEKMIREEAMDKINKLPIDYFSLEPDGKIVAKITSDSLGVRTFYTTLFTIINAILNIIIVYISVIIMEPMLGLIILIIVPILLVWITLYRKWIHKYHLQLRELGSRITGKLNENISGALIIQDYNLEDKIKDEYKDITGRYIHYDRIVAGINNTFGFELVALIKRSITIVLLMYLGHLAANGASYEAVSIGLVGALVDYLGKMIDPFNKIFNTLNELEDSLVGATRCYGFIDELDDTRVNDGLESDDEIIGDVKFDNIWFAYNNDKYVLKGLNLEVEHGKTIGIVGKTGAGKSSLMNLLLGFNDYQKGHLLIDGKEFSDYKKTSIRKHMGIVLQTPAIFSGTLKSNITMERNFSDEEVINVLTAVGGEHLLNKSDDGINMKVGFKGDNLSLGEKQLISFARILLRNPKIVVLDEATANIDTETEIKTKNAMNVVSKGRTTFIIAHRLSTIKNADEIIVLDDGNIVGKGSHAELYNTCAQYKDMYDSQYSGKTK